ncbi:MAG: superoxide dismutase family protein [Pseudazoarcus pumilus]|nr:superoxide dismutase family protein [Pseudazoarcus pumilus]
MKLHRTLSGLTLIALMSIASGAHAQAKAYVQFVGAYGEDYGTATLTQTPKGVLIKAALKGLPPGEAALRIHAVGACSPPFSSAGGAFEAAGEMPKIDISGAETSVEMLNNRVTLERGSANSLIDGRGTALIVHVRRGSNSTMRMACGVVRL